MVQDRLRTVSAGNTREILYQSDTQTLRVTFAGGASYDYFNVPADVAAVGFDTELSEEWTVGKWVNASIKGTYEYKKLEAQ